MLDDLLLTERVADAGDVVDVEPCYELSGEGIVYLATHSLASAPDDGEAA